MGLTVVQSKLAISRKMDSTVNIEEENFDPTIHPRKKPNNSGESYADPVVKRGTAVIYLDQTGKIEAMDAINEVGTS